VEENDSMGESRVVDSPFWWGGMGMVSVLGLGWCLVQAFMMREWRIVGVCLFLWGGEACMFAYWLWSVFRYRNTKNELRIIETLWKSCK